MRSLLDGPVKGIQHVVCTSRRLNISALPLATAALHCHKHKLQGLIAFCNLMLLRIRLDVDGPEYYEHARACEKPSWRNNSTQMYFSRCSYLTISLTEAQLQSFLRPFRHSMTNTETGRESASDRAIDILLRADVGGLLTMQFIHALS